MPPRALIAHTLRCKDDPKQHALLLLYITILPCTSCKNCLLIEIIAKKCGSLLCKMWNPKIGLKTAQNMCAVYGMNLVIETIEMLDKKKTEQKADQNKEEFMEMTEEEMANLPFK